MKAKIAVFMVSHAVYDKQFPGLYDNFYKYHKDFINIVVKNGVEVVDFGMVDSSEAGFEVAEKINGSGADLIMCNMITYATSSVFVPDIKTCIAMLIMDRLGIGGSFAEFHPFDFEEDFILVGHDGPHHIAIAEGKPILRSLKKIHGYSKKGAIPPTGNTNTRGFFEPTTKEFVKKWVMEGPTHHYALGVGHRAETIRKTAQVLGIQCVVVKRLLNILLINV